MYSEDVDELIQDTQRDVYNNTQEILDQGDEPEFSIVLLGNTKGKVFTSRWVGDADGNALDMIRGMADLVDAIDEDQSRNSNVERGEILGAMRGCIEALQQAPDVTFDQSKDMEAER